MAATSSVPIASFLMREDACAAGKKEDVVEEVRTLAEHGYQEVVLTGIHLSSYGLEWKDENGKQTEGLLDLIRAVHEVEGIKRIRLGSLEPRIVTEEFAKELACLPKICPHFHLSLQSGCDATLKRMNRRYDAAEYREKCELLRKYFEKSGTDNRCDRRIPAGIRGRI